MAFRIQEISNQSQLIAQCKIAKEVSNLKFLLKKEVMQNSALNFYYILY
jgi:hypothetical protein